MAKSDESGATMKPAKRLASLVDLLLLAASVSMGGPVARQAQLVAGVACALLACLVLFGAGALVIGLRDRRKPPFPMVGDRP